MAKLAVEVIHAWPDRVLRLPLTLDAGATVDTALAAAAGDPQFAALDLEHAAVGIFGTLASRTEPLCDGDRVEIYRGPAADAKAARRARLKPQKR